MIVAIVRHRRMDTASRLKRAANGMLHQIVVPGHEGDEIQIEYLLLTRRGIRVLEIKHVDGNVFGGDRLDEWTVIATSRRYTFTNPQGALRDRVAAVTALTPSVPVIGQIVFTGQAEFPKGRPGAVSTLAELLDELAADDDPGPARPVIEAFMPAWEKLRAEARPVTSIRRDRVPAGGAESE